MRRFICRFLTTLTLATFTLGNLAQAAKDELVIGMTQFPDTFNPIINAMVAKSYVLAMTLRPFILYDQRWELICMLCTRVPSIENGLARRETLADGREGIAVTLDIQPDVTWSSFLVHLS